MDNAMVKRGIGAVVLAIIAALLLGYLLKDKSSERQKVVDMKLPGAPELNIPSLTGSSEPTTPPAILVNETTEKVTENVKKVESEVVAAAAGTASKLKDAGKDVLETVSSSSKPGFAIRPPSANEQRETVDNTSSNEKQTTEKELKTTIVASTTASAPKKPTKPFKPSLVEEKKKPVKKKVVKPKAPAKKAKDPVAKKPEKTAAPVAANTSPAPSGKYSVQLLATSSQSRANKLSTTMKGEGYNSFITQTTKNNKVLYRVRLGAHNDRNAAMKAQQNLKRRYQKNFFVQNSLVVSN